MKIFGVRASHVGSDGFKIRYPDPAITTAAIITLNIVAPAPE